jgi:ABC-2 type transport system ATP-binding protein
MPDEIAIQIDDLRHAYKTVNVLREISLQVARSSILGLLGPNGSGKSTLFRILSTLIPLQSGRVSVFGRPLQTAAPEIRRLIGVSFQSPALDARLTVAENLKCHARIYGMAAKDYAQRSSFLLDRFELKDRINNLAGTLSGGFKRRVDLIKSLLHSPQMLLLDEPTAGLDPLSRRNFWDVLHQYRLEHGMTIVVATHLLDEAERCDALALLCEGQVVATGAPLELRASLGHSQFRIRCHDMNAVRERIDRELNSPTEVHGDLIMLPVTDPVEQMELLLKLAGEHLISIEIARPTLEDVFLHHTGRSLHETMGVT